MTSSKPPRSRPKELNYQSDPPRISIKPPSDSALPPGILEGIRNSNPMETDSNSKPPASDPVIPRPSLIPSFPEIKEAGRQSIHDFTVASRQSLHDIKVASIKAAPHVGISAMVLTGVAIGAIAGSTMYGPSIFGAVEPKTERIAKADCKEEGDTDAKASKKGKRNLFIAGDGVHYAIEKAIEPKKRIPVTNDGICDWEAGERDWRVPSVFDPECGYCGNNAAEEVEIIFGECFVDTHLFDGVLTPFEKRIQEVPVFNPDGKLIAVKEMVFEIIENCVRGSDYYDASACEGIRRPRNALGNLVSSAAVENGKDDEKTDNESLNRACQNAIANSYSAQDLLRRVSNQIYSKQDKLMQRCGMTEMSDTGIAQIAIGIDEGNTTIQSLRVRCVGLYRNTPKELSTAEVVGIVGEIKLEPVDVMGHCRMQNSISLHAPIKQ